jgi:hypothetical protein
MKWKQGEGDKIGGCSRLPNLPVPFLAVSETCNVSSTSRSNALSSIPSGKKKRDARTDTRERSTSAVRSSRSCPDARSSHSVTSVMNVKDAPSAGRPAAVASFSTCCEGAQPSISTGRYLPLASQRHKGTHTRMHNPCFCAAARRRRMNIVISACPTGVEGAPHVVGVS